MIIIVKSDGSERGCGAADSARPAIVFNLHPYRSFWFRRLDGGEQINILEENHFKIEQRLY